MNRMSTQYRDALNRVTDGNQDAEEINTITGVPIPVIRQMIRTHWAAIRNQRNQDEGPEF